MKQLQYKKSEYQGKLTSSDLKKFGLDSSPKTVESLIELRKEPLNYVLATCIKKDVEFQQEGFDKQKLKKGHTYLMTISVYQQLWYDPYRKRKNLKPTSNNFPIFYNPYKGEDLNNKTLLVIRTGGIGDLLFIQPNLIYLKNKYPNCKINLSCGPQYHAMIKNWDCVDNVYCLPLSKDILISSDYHAIFEGVIERCTEALNKNAYNLFSTWMGLDLPDTLLIPKQIPELSLVEKCKDKLKEWNVKDFILIQMKASSPIRTPRSEFWIDIINSLVEKGNNVILTDSPYMSKQIDEFMTYIKKENRDKVFNFCEHSKLISDTIAMASLSNCNVAPDSSLVHISESLKVPCVAFYGAFPPKIRISTYDHVKAINSEIKCAPCFLHGQNICKNSKNNHPICFDNMDKNNIIEIIEDHKR